MRGEDKSGPRIVPVEHGFGAGIAPGWRPCGALWRDPDDPSSQLQWRYENPKDTGTVRGGHPIGPASAGTTTRRVRTR